MFLATIKRLPTLLTCVERTRFREICRLFRIANPEVASHYTHDPIVVAEERTVLREGTAGTQVKSAAVIIVAVRRSAASGEVLDKLERRKKAGVHEECPRFNEYVRGKEHDELGNISHRGIGEQGPHEKVGLSEAWIFLVDEFVV
jgi:hypothetical protein